MTPENIARYTLWPGKKHSLIIHVDNRTEALCTIHLCTRGQHIRWASRELVQTSTRYLCKYSHNRLNAWTKHGRRNNITILKEYIPLCEGRGFGIFVSFFFYVQRSSFTGVDGHVTLALSTAAHVYTVFPSHSSRGSTRLGIKRERIENDRHENSMGVTWITMVMADGTAGFDLALIHELYNIYGSTNSMTVSLHNMDTLGPVMYRNQLLVVHQRYLNF